MRGAEKTRALAVALASVGVFLFGISTADAQVGCRTANCNAGATPPSACTNRATPYRATVLATTALVFVPANPKIEPGDCIAFTDSGTITHSASADNCNDTGTVCTTVDSSCEFDSGNLTSASPSEVCFYDTVNFPAGDTSGYYCRVHSNPTHTLGNMFGTIQITTPIDVAVTKNTGTGDIVVSWTGGGVTGDVTYKVVRSLVGDPLFTVGANTVTGDPDGGTAGTAFTELGGLNDPATHYYFIRNKQTNE
jgi:plastocyanin